MPYTATILPVMIASPSDVLDYRTAARGVLHEWNYVHSVSGNVVLMPVGWETHASPDLGHSAQDLINERILDQCDLLVGVFWTRLGTPTSRASSGSAEEIQRHVAQGKPTMVYFSRSPAALETVDPQQYESLKSFRSWCESKGLVEYIDNVTDFEWKFRRQLQITLNDSPHIRRVLGQPFSSSNGQAAEGASDGNKSIAFVASALSQQTRHLLLEATLDKDGVVQHTSLFSGPLVETNGKAIVSPKDQDGQTLWNYMLPQLLELGLLVSLGNRAPRLSLYRVTPLAKGVAQYIRDGTK